MVELILSPEVAKNISGLLPRAWPKLSGGSAGLTDGQPALAGDYAGRTGDVGTVHLLDGGKRDRI